MAAISVDQDTIIQAFRAHASTLKSQSDVLTFAEVRRLLEREIGLEAFALDPHKQLINKLLEETLTDCKADEQRGNTTDDGMEFEKSKLKGDGFSKYLDKNGNADCSVKSANVQEEKSDVLQSKEADIKKVEETGKICQDEGEKKTQSDQEDSQDINEGVIKEALLKRASYVKDNIEHLSLGDLRRLLENDLHLEKKALDSQKKIISKLVDEILAMPVDDVDSGKKSNKKNNSRNSQEDHKVKSSEKNSEKLNNGDVEFTNVKSKISKVKKRNSEYSDAKIASVKKQKNSVKDDSKLTRKQKMEKSAVEKESETNARKRAESDGDEGDSEIKNNLTLDSEDSKKDLGYPKVVKKQEGKMAMSGPSGYAKQIDNLKKIIQACGMRVPTIVYRKAKQISEGKREEYLVEELHKILEKEGLSSNPSRKEIIAVKKRRERAKDLEGIDTTNIISETRPRRSASSFFSIPPVQDKMPDVDSDSDDESADESDDEEPIKGSDEEEQDPEESD